MMTHAEEQEIGKKIAKHENLPGLSKEQMTAIRGMYRAADVLHRYDVDNSFYMDEMPTVQKVLREIGDQVRRDILELLYVDILNCYVAFREENGEMEGENGAD